MTDDALGIRRSAHAKSRFASKRDNFYRAIAKSKGTDVIRKRFEVLTDVWSTVAGKHDIYMIHSKRRKNFCK